MKCEICGVDTRTNYGDFGRTLCADCSPLKEEKWPSQNQRDATKKGQGKRKSKYTGPRGIAVLVNIVGWVAIVVGVLTFLPIIFDEDGDFFWNVVGLFSVGQGIVIVLASYGLMAVFDMADDSSRTVSRLEGIFRLLSERDERSGKGKEAVE